MDITLHKLDKIIWLLEKIVEQGDPQEMTIWGKYHEELLDAHPNTIINSPDSTTNTDPICNCHEHRSGKEGTGGWYCPVHGQRF